MITVNGKERELPRELTLAEFLEQENYKVSRIAVELNGEIIPKATYADVLLHSGDVLEVVSFVGGG
ncbi:MAG: sulfur carrier protein ThiS [Eubacteriales bacterium]|nr:sulfur carrier protein ThiS [Eubacteriales bacterium]